MAFFRLAYDVNVNEAQTHSHSHWNEAQSESLRKAGEAEAIARVTRLEGEPETMDAWGGVRGGVRGGGSQRPISWPPIGQQTSRRFTRRSARRWRDFRRGGLCEVCGGPSVGSPCSQEQHGAQGLREVALRWLRWRGRRRHSEQDTDSATVVYMYSLRKVCSGDRTHT